MRERETRRVSEIVRERQVEIETHTHSEIARERE